MTPRRTRLKRRTDELPCGNRAADREAADDDTARQQICTFVGAAKIVSSYAMGGYLQLSYRDLRAKGRCGEVRI